MSDEDFVKLEMELSETMQRYLIACSDMGMDFDDRIADVTHNVKDDSF